MSSRGDQQFLSDILEAIRRAGLYIAGMDDDQILAELE
jgi:uncharacterized protein with HEPN domain